MRREGEVGVWLSVEFEDGEEGLLGNLYPAYLLHTFFALLLLLEELALSGDIATIALGSDILADGFDSFARDHLSADSSLDGDIELLARDEFLELFTHPSAELHRVVGMSECGEGIYTLAIEEDIEFYEIGGSEIMDMIIERGVALRDRLQFVVEVDHNFAEGHIESDLHAVAGDIFLLDEFATLAKAEGHDRADELSGSDDSGADIWFLDMVDESGVGKTGWVVHLEFIALLVVYEI